MSPSPIELPTHTAVATLLLDSTIQVWYGLVRAGLADERRAVERVGGGTGSAASHDTLKRVGGGRGDTRIEHLGAGRLRRRDLVAVRSP
jgi:hypothetical protein